LGHLS
jgi:hypothetical protein